MVVGVIDRDRQTNRRRTRSRDTATATVRQAFVATQQRPNSLGLRQDRNGTPCPQIRAAVITAHNAGNRVAHIVVNGRSRCTRIRCGLQADGKACHIGRGSCIHKDTVTRKDPAVVNVGEHLHGRGIDRRCDPHGSPATDIQAKAAGLQIGQGICRNPHGLRVNFTLVQQNLRPTTIDAIGRGSTDSPACTGRKAPGVAALNACLRRGDIDDRQGGIDRVGWRGLLQACDSQRVGIDRRTA